ncbi:MAG: triose-phosphate isomerase [Alphaproteobacteria bacterium]|nr:triose-phosphate isomerase [Alphaproteobacteria bacterium]
MTRRVPLIAGNWKMHGLKADSLALARAVVAGAAKGRDLLVCPSAVLIPPVADALTGSAVMLGGQDCHFEGAGAHTGDIAASMLADAGCSHVILGHSERRADHGEDDGIVRAKTAAAHAAGLVAIVCVGETLEERDDGRTLERIGTQLEGSLPDAATPDNTVIAYEPVWAIGTGRTPTPDDVAEVHAHIRGWIAAKFGAVAGDGMRILYGGSMKPSNAAELLAIDGVDGGLIGGASLNAQDFLAIAANCP